MSHRRRALIVSLLTLVPFATSVGAAQAHTSHHVAQTTQQTAVGVPWEWLCLDHYSVNLMVLPDVTLPRICLPGDLPR